MATGKKRARSGKAKKPGAGPKPRAQKAEQLQSANEEVQSANNELQNRNLELSHSNNDLTNLLASVQLAIVMLGPDLRVRRYTPAAEKLFNLIQGDVGRPLADIKLSVETEE